MANTFTNQVSITKLTLQNGKITDIHSIENTYSFLFIPILVHIVIVCFTYQHRTSFYYAKQPKSQFINSAVTWRFCRANTFFKKKQLVVNTRIPIVDFATDLGLTRGIGIDDSLNVDKCGERYKQEMHSNN